MFASANLPTVSNFPSSQLWRYLGMWRYLGILCILSAGCTAEKVAPNNTASNLDSKAPQSLLRAELPPPRDQSYVGSEACVECHAKISEQYAQHPMGMSISQVSNMHVIEKPSEDWLDVAGPDKYKVKLEVDPSGKSTKLVHQQWHFDSKGETLGENKEEVAFAIGSGQKGRAYFIFKDRMLFQSPIGWYTAKSCWDLSPGYSPERHPGFQRRIDNSCLYCHSGRVDSQNDQQYSSKVFHETVIGCERCHGPGEKHITFHREKSQTANSGKSSTPVSDPICNPADLAPQLREEVCNQCHLQAEQVIPRFGRNFFDFRPGDRLEDVFVIFSSSTRQEGRGNFRAVSHVEQMRSSRCYLAAPDKMGCISCHDPHTIPNETQRVQHYRQSCLKCHQKQGCSLPLEQRQKTSVEDSCIQCHMPKSDISNVPHTAQTDHRIVRTTQSATETPPTKAWTVVDGAQERLPAWEVSRARGLAMMTSALKKRDQSMAIKAREYLVPAGDPLADPRQVITALANDPESLAAIGSSYWIEGLYANARPYWEKTLEADPAHETALSGLIQIDLDSNDLVSAEIRAKKLVEIAPAEATHWVQLSSIQWKLFQYDAAITAAENAVKLDPSLDDTRIWLIQAKEKRKDGTLDNLVP